jgi:hypothetical protein
MIMVTSPCSRDGRDADDFNKRGAMQLGSAAAAPTRHWYGVTETRAR